MDSRQLAPAPEGAQSTALALPREIALMQTVDSELAQRALAIYLSRQSAKPISPARAISAALNERETGHREGRDFYVDEKMGLVPGYRGLMRDNAEAGGGSHMEQYRPMNGAEATEHEIKAGDTATICELTQIHVFRQAREVGLTYRPVLGIGIVRAREKVYDGQPINLTGGYTWERKARNRSYKDALRHAGYAAQASEVLDEAEQNGVHVEIPEGEHISVEQAEFAVAQACRLAGRIPDNEVLRKATVDAMRGPEGFRGYGDEDEGDIVTGTAREIETGDPDAAAKIATAEAQARADADFAAMQSRSATGAPVTGPAPEAKPQRPYPVDVLSAGLKAKHAPAQVDPEKVRKGGSAALSDLFGSDDNQHAALGVLFGLKSRKDLTLDQWYAIKQWCSSAKDETGVWIPSSFAIEEARLVMDEARRQSGQVAMFEEPGQEAETVPA